jgi:NAD+ synthetase
MGTGHLSEDLIGYDTKGGDALADIFILAEFTKSEVYQLARFYNVPASILDAVPSAGLYHGQTDEEELGHTYEVLEPATLALYHLLKRGIPDSEIAPNRPEFAGLNPIHVEFVVGRFLANAHKHRAPAIVQIRRAEWFSN